jgi:hypothetical protein
MTNPLTLDDIKFASRMSQSRIRGALELVEKFKTDPDRERRLQRGECVACFYTTRIAGQAFTSYSCALCQAQSQYHNTAVPKLCPSCAEHNGLCVRCCADKEGSAAALERTQQPTPAAE